MPKRSVTGIRLQAETIPELISEWETAVIRLREGEEFRGRKVRPGPMLSAVVLAFLRTVPHEQQRAMVRYGLRELEKMYEMPDPGPGTTPDPDPVKLQVRSIPEKPVGRKPTGKKRG